MTKTTTYFQDLSLHLFALKARWDQDFGLEDYVSADYTAAYIFQPIALDSLWHN